MELRLVQSTHVAIVHKGEQVDFPIMGGNAFGNTTLVKIVADDEGKPYNCFGDINDFMRTLNREQQQTIFNVYLELADLFSSASNMNSLETHLVEGFKTIYDIVTVDAVQKFMTEPTDRIPVPLDVINNVADHYAEERTYTPLKYKGLISLSIVLKLAIPIWGAYIRYITRGTGVGRKEIHCTRLLSKSTVVKSKQYEEFVDFIVFTHEAGKGKPDSIIAGFGTEEQAMLLPAACLVRKIAVTPNLASVSVVSVAFSYIAKDGPGHDRRFPIMKPKKIEKGTMVEERALLEIYQMNESISVGDIEAITYYCENLPIVMSKIKEDITQEEIDRAVELRDHLIKVKFKPTLMNIRLVQFFIKGIPPQIVPHLDSEDFIKLMDHLLKEDRIETKRRLARALASGNAEPKKIRMLEKRLAIKTNPEDFRTYAVISLLAALFTILVKDYPTIALLCTAYPTITTGIDSSIGNSRKQIPSDIDAKLDELYPLRISGGKDSVNMVKDAISRYFNQFSGKLYRSYYTPYFTKYVEKYEDREGNHYLRADTPINLAKITIEIYG